MVKLIVKSVSPASPEESRRNIEYARSLGFPRLGKAEKERLAVVGGGTSIKKRWQELKDFDGDIWAINGAWYFLKVRGLDPWFFSVDPTDAVTKFANGAKRAILAMDSHPSLFDALKDAHVEAVELSDLPHGPTTSTCAPAIGSMRGYREISFYGCEGNFGATTHAYGNFGLGTMLKVRCDGGEYLTSADMMVQVEYLGKIIRACHPVLKDCSGGLLGAYIRDPDIDVLAATRDFHDEVMERVERQRAEKPLELAGYAMP